MLGITAAAALQMLKCALRISVLNPLLGPNSFIHPFHLIINCQENAIGSKTYLVHFFTSTCVKQTSNFNTNFYKAWLQQLSFLVYDTFSFTHNPLAACYYSQGQIRRGGGGHRGSGACPPP